MLLAGELRMRQRTPLHIDTDLSQPRQQVIRQSCVRSLRVGRALSSKLRRHAAIDCLSSGVSLHQISSSWKYRFSFDASCASSIPSPPAPCGLRLAPQNAEPSRAWLPFAANSASRVGNHLWPMLEPVPLRQRYPLSFARMSRMLSNALSPTPVTSFARSFRRACSCVCCL